MTELFTWIGIALCISQSALFSGLNLAFFSLTRLRLEIESENDTSIGARTVLELRKDSNFLLTTILWGNVGINVLLTLLSDSVMTGVLSFTFSTVIITLFGEIVPQAYFSRHALKMASLLAPVLRFYQIILYPVAKPCAILLDKWLGKEAVQFFSEQNIKMFLQKHVDDDESEIGQIEGTGAINFLALDDQQVIVEGEELNPTSIVLCEEQNGELVLPQHVLTMDNLFVKSLNDSGEKWIVLIGLEGTPKLVLDADGFIRSLVSSPDRTFVKDFCHEPIVVTDPTTKLGRLLKTMKKGVHHDSDAPIDVDIVIYWGLDQKRIITGADMLGRLLKGIG